MSRVTETVYLDRDNIISLVILEDGEPVADLSGITRVVLTVAGAVLDSDVVGATVIWWTDQVTYEEQTVDALSLRLGHEDLTPGTYEDGCLVLFNVYNPAGVVYAKNLRFKIVEGCSLTP